MMEPSTGSNDGDNKAATRRRNRKRFRIPVPSFAPIHDTSRAAALPARQTQSHLPLSTRVACQNPTAPSHPPPSQQPQPTSSAELLVQPRRHRSSRIGGVLSYQRYLQHVDPSLPKHYTRKELRVMNDETPPDRNQEDTPPSRATKGTKTVSATLTTHAKPHHTTPPPGGSTASVQAPNRQQQAAVAGTPIYSTQPTVDTSAATTEEVPPLPSSASPTQPLVTKRQSLILEPKRLCVEEDGRTQAASLEVDNTTADPSIDDNNNSSSSSSNNGNSFRLYFVPRGRDMHEGVLEGPKRIARARGATVLETFNPHQKHYPKPQDPTGNASDNTLLPTHLVVGSVSSPEVVSRALGFANPLALQHYLYTHRMQCVTKAWATHIPRGSHTRFPPYQQPRPSFVLQQLGIRHLEVYAPLLPRAPPMASAATSTSTAMLTTGNEGRHRGQSTCPPRNVKLAKLFKQLAKAYQSAPMEDNDPWRAYTFENAASRVQALDFEIKCTESLRRVERLKGFGKSTVDIIREYINGLDEHEEDEEQDDNGTAENGRPVQRQVSIERLRLVNQDPQRKALRAMMKIWGVGPTKGLELVRAGYHTVDQVRKDFEANRLTVKLQRNQYVGILCHDDILEDMDRSEVNAIANIIRRAVRSYYSEAQVEIMGSYRRGSEFCGDVDILLTHKKFVHKVPPQALGKIVDSLRLQGHIAYHLTHLAGMDTDAWETLPQDVSGRFAQSNVVRSHSGKDGCSSYMGIINSPVYPGKKRRIDVKFYPHRERIFAAMYFTGNGLFNRSMRLWAKRKFGYRLSDHGMFQLGSEDVRVMDAVNEEQIFRRLGLVYRGPTERDGFDAVISLDLKQRATDLEALSGEEFFREESQHEWIK